MARAAQLRAEDLKAWEQQAQAQADGTGVDGADAGLSPLPGEVQSRLAALGHKAGDIARIDCPIGDPSLGKHPQAIAVGVAMAFLRRDKGKNASRQENAV